MLILSTAIFFTAAAALARQAGETTVAVPKVDERDNAIVYLTTRRNLWRHRAEVRARVIHKLWRKLAERAKQVHHSAVTSTSTAGWSSAQATWYGPGFYGHSPACGGNGVLTESSWWVATVPSSCGTPYTICDASNGKCVHVTSQDTGGFTPGNFDMTPAVARALGGLYTHTVRYRRG